MVRIVSSIRSHDIVMILIKAHPTHAAEKLREESSFYLNAVKMDRKRQRAPSSEIILQQPESTSKHPKLTLKPPDFLTSKQKQHETRKELSQHLETMLGLETQEEVTEHLLRLIELYKGKVKTSVTNETGEEISKCLSALGKLAKCHKEVISVCCVLVHGVEVFVHHWRDRMAGSLPKNVQSFILSLLDHGKIRY